MAVLGNNREPKTVPPIAIYIYDFRLHTLK